MIDKKQPIIVKKVIHGGHGHHGGAWKVAFADFATAMMAFFLLLWLMGGTSDEEKAAISEYFDNPSMASGVSSSPAPSSIQGPGGASTSLIQLGGALDMPKKDEDRPQTKKELEEEKKQLDDLMEKIKEAIETNSALKQFKDQLLLDITPEGLRIQIVDKENRPMFDSGKANLKFYTFEILMELAQVINEAPNRISISGHTDATPFNKDDYSNWELSADRANAARRAMIDGGLLSSKIGRVVGLADSVLFDKNNPYSPINRRIAIIVMNKKTEQAISRGEGVTEKFIQDRRELFDQPLPESGQTAPSLLSTLPSPGDSVIVEEGIIGQSKSQQQNESAQPSIAPPVPKPAPPKEDSPVSGDEDVLDLPMEYL